LWIAYMKGVVGKALNWYLKQLSSPQIKKVRGYA
jgi:hypothetical protein